MIHQNLFSLHTNPALSGISAWTEDYVKLIFIINNVGVVSNFKWKVDSIALPDPILRMHIA